MDGLKKIETYGGKIPQRLIDYCEKLNEQNGIQVVYQIGNEPENACDGHRNSYWIYSNTVTFTAMECGTIHEDTVADCIRMLKCGFTIDSEKVEVRQ